MKTKIEKLEIELKRNVSHRNRKQGLKTVKKIHKYITSKDGLTNDIIIRLLGLCCNFYRDFNFVNENIKHLKYLANLYLDYNQIQAAYRAIEEAMEVAILHSRWRDYINLLELLLAACYENEDLDSALECYERIRECSLNVQMEPRLMANLATIYMQKELYSDAIDIFESIIVEEPSLQLIVKSNLAICYREKGEPERSVSLLESANTSSVHNKEALIEYELIYAKSLIYCFNYREAISRLCNAVSIIQHQMEEVIKVHYRRGIREKYVARLENLILSIPEEYMTEDVLFILSFSRSNQLSDWMRLLCWCDNLYEWGVPEKDIIDIKENIQAVAENGAPFLYGMIEKYDDHNDIYHAWRWNGLNESINSIVSKYNVQTPFFHEGIYDVFREIWGFLDHSALMISFLSIQRKLLLVNRGKFRVITIDEEVFSDYISSFIRYKSEELSSQKFARKLEEVHQYMSSLLNEFIIDVDKEEVGSVVYFPDRFSDFPITSVFYCNESLNKKMVQGNFFIKSVPIMFIYQDQYIDNQYSKVIGICDNSDLVLSRLEIENFSNNLKVKNICMIEKNDDETFRIEVEDSDIIHVTTHGEPIDFYSDPCHVSLLHKGHVIDIHSIQTKLYKLNYKIALLNSCHSSSNLLRRQVSLSERAPKLNNIRSHDTFSLSTSLLINRKSRCIASSWKTFDKFSYVLSHQFSKNLIRFRDVERAFSASIAELVSVTESSLLNILDKDNEHQKAMIDNKNGTISMFKHPYAYATYQCFSLL